MIHHLPKLSNCHHGMRVLIAVVFSTSLTLNTSDRVYAQIIEDQTLPNNSQVTPSNQSFLIQGGTEIGNSLFHSFSSFSLPTDHTAHFDNQPYIENIFSRVTGGTSSQINGIIKANERANLFIINPNGIIFGAKARLEIGGSFFASTANSINFADGGIFSAKPEASTPLLNIKTPIGLQIGGTSELDANPKPKFQTPIAFVLGMNPGSIYVQGESSFNPTILEVKSLQTLALLGGNVILENANITTEKSSGRIEIGSVVGAGLVGIKRTELGFTFDFDAASNLGNLQISGNTNISHLFDIQLTAKNIIFNNGMLRVENDITLNARENIELLNNTSIDSTSSGRFPSTITINTQNLLVRDGAYIAANKGNLIINASERVQMISNPDSDSQRTSRIFATASEDTTKTTGNLTINTRHLSIVNGGQILTNAGSNDLRNFMNIVDDAAPVQRGNLTVNASESVTLSGSSLSEIHPSGLFTRNFHGKDSGSLTINTKVLSIADGAQVMTANSSSEAIGKLTVNATDKIEIIGTSATGKIATNTQQNNLLIDEPIIDTSLVFLSSIQGLRINNTLPSGLFSNTTAGGDAGNIDINTRELFLRDGGQISANVFSKGRGGDLTVNASEQVQLLATSASGISSGLFTRLNPKATADAGNVTVLTRNLLVQNGAQVSASTFASGKGGNVNVQATDSIKLIGISPQNAPSGLFSQANSGSTGDAGELTVNTYSLLVRDGAQISASTFSTGKGGNLNVQAREKIELIGTSLNGDLFPSGLFAVAAPGATGDAGNLRVDTTSLLVRDGAQVGASTNTQAQAGNLTLDVADKVQLIGTAINGAFPSGLFATATANSTGDAGNLTMNTSLLQISQGAGIAVRNRGLGSGGNLFVNARAINLDNQAFISADTRGVSNNSSQSQGNITLRSQDLILLRGNSSITTNAIGNNVVGGNIDIETKLLAAFENSDISANSADFRGGRVKVTAQGIIGTQFRNSLTPESDITATGATPDLSGTVEIITPEVDPSQDLTELPANVTDVANQIAQKCRGSQAIAKQANEFLVTGKGGTPINPYDTLQSESAIANWIDVNNITKNHTNSPKIPHSPETTIVEAQALAFDSQGNLVLTAESANLTPQNPALTHPVCAS